jgi:hypothetical protein
VRRDDDRRAAVPAGVYGHGSGWLQPDELGTSSYHCQCQGKSGAARAVGGSANRWRSWMESWWCQVAAPARALWSPGRSTTHQLAAVQVLLSWARGAGVNASFHPPRAGCRCDGGRAEHSSSPPRRPVGWGATTKRIMIADARHRR